MFKNKLYMIIALTSVILLSMCGGYVYYIYSDNPSVIDVNEIDSPITPVVKNADDNKGKVTTTTTTSNTELVNPNIPSVTPSIKESFRRPVKDGEVVKAYFNEKKDINELKDALTLFNDIYYPNNGVNYGNNAKDFSVLAITSGNVENVYDDPSYGLCVLIKSNGYEITYQSLKDTPLKKGSVIKQGDHIGNAGKNKYDENLGINVRVLVVKNGVYLDLEDLIGKAL